ncbi:MAG: LacI family transcriptional regulator [Chloroflexi bacterium]|nr:LacI family transcriptional regulator [Chloroflexota bacterium]MCL5075965.1 LacI family transcriptional regulator [Chloroflexota bacterium]
MTTIIDVARRAGVSVGTVSNVINDTFPVRESLRQRVQQAIEELHYRPNAVAQSLRSQRTRTIGLVISDIGDPFYMAIARAVADQSGHYGYNIIICNTDEGLAEEKRSLETLAARRVDGLIVAPSRGAHDFLSTLGAKGLSIVLINRRLEGVAIPAVIVNNRLAAYQAVEHLIQLGHERIALLPGLEGVSTTQDRREGYLMAHNDYRLVPDEELCQYSPLSVAEARERMRHLLEMEQPPTAIVACSILMTLGVLHALNDQRRCCPTDMALIGFGESEWSRLISPPLTCVEQPIRAIGITAVDLLFACMRGDQVDEENIVLETTLVHRQSCGCR